MGERGNRSDQFAPLEQSPHMFSVDFSVVQSLLSFISVQGHLPVDLHRKRIVLDTIQGKPACAVIEGRRNRAQQPILQDPDTAHAALVEIEPVIRDLAFCRTCKWHTPQEFEQGGLERNAIRFPFQLVAGKMNRQAAPPNLPIEFAKIEQIVGSHQDVQNSRLAQGLEPL